MRVKKQFLNKKDMAAYGFREEILYPESNLREYCREERFCKIFTQRVDGTLAISIPTERTDCVNIPNILFQMIIDGIVEL